MQNAEAARLGFDPFSSLRVGGQAHRQAAQVWMFRARGARRGGDEEHRVQAQVALGLHHGITIFIVALAQRREAHETAGNVVGLLLIQDAQHALPRGKLIHIGPFLFSKHDNFRSDFYPIVSRKSMFS
jgi:translation elongation factor EF-Tu-like GTPase